MNKFKRIRNNLIISGMAVVLLCACSGGGGGASLYNSSDGLHNGGKSGWGSSSGNNGSTSGSGSLLSSAGVTPPSDIDWQQIDVTVSCTRNGVTTTTTITNSTNSSEIQEVLSSFQIGDVVSISADVTMQDGTHRQTSSGAVTIGPGDNHFSLPTPYVATFDTTIAKVPQIYTDLGLSPPSVSGGSTSVDYNRLSGGTAPAVTPPGGYKLDHWETAAGDVFSFGSSRGDLTVYPVFVYDYTCSYSDLTLSTLPIINQNDFDDLINTHGAQDFSGKTITLYSDVSTTKGFTAGTAYTGGFAGTLDGNSHTINVSIRETSLSSGSGIGLVYNNGGTIKNLVVTGTVENTVSISDIWVGGVAGANSGTIECCGNNATVISSHLYSSGITGLNNSGCIVKNCYNTGTIKAGAISGGPTSGASQQQVAGIVSRNSGTIQNCYNTGNLINCIDSNGSYGGIAALSYVGTIENCYSTITPNGVAGSTCGDIVASTNGNNISNVYCNGIVSGSASLTATGTVSQANTDLPANYPSIWEAGSGRPKLIGVPGQ